MHLNLTHINLLDRSRPVHVIYHDKCIDGFFSAALMKISLKERGYRMVEFHAGKYHGTMDWEKFRTQQVVFVDFSARGSELKNLLKYVDKNDIYVLDHHKSAVKELVEAGLWNQVAHVCYAHENNMSGVGIVYSFCNLGYYENMPSPLTYIQDNDLYLHKLESTKPISTVLEKEFKSYSGMEGVEYAESFIHEWNTNFYKDTYFRGLNIMKENQKKIEALKPMTGFSGGTSVMIFTEIPKDIKNEASKFWYSKDEVNMVINLEHVDNGVKCSCRGDGSVDTTILAEEFAGGGHRDASGFVLPVSSFELAAQEIIEAIHHNY